MNKGSRAYKIFIVGLSLLILMILILLSLSLGSSNIKISEIIPSVFHGQESEVASQIIAYVRIPRTVSAILAGCGLALSGLILQSVLNNALASPTIIGVNSGLAIYCHSYSVYPSKY